ncbi:leucine-rich repeat protein [Paenibacillus oryzisoli]|uniref:leucine-rich repeat protein n=1 Tax=Paenibacillus oryzisoli TaxID=1850517 RepID=UPI003D2D4A5D
MLQGFSRKIGLIALSIVLLLGSVISIPVSSAATDGDFQYEDLGGGTAKITNYTGTNGVDVVIPNLVGGGLIVVEIGVDAFNTRQIPSLTIPNSVTTIGKGAFQGNQLTNLTLPSSLTTIGIYAFSENQLASLTIPDSVTTIGQGAFKANQLTNLILPSNLTTIGVDAFKNNQLATLTIPDNATTIEQGVFQSNNLTSLTLPSSLTTIGVDAFRGNQLATLTIPDNVTTIGQGAFQSNNLTSLTLPSNLTTIGIDAFRDNQLATLTIPIGVTTIEEAAFLDNNLTSVTLPNSLTTIGPYAFRGNQLPSLTIPDSVTTIGQGAFQANQLTSLPLPSNLTTIGVDAFRENQLSSLTIPDSVTTIGQGAFLTNNLTNLTLPSSLTTIGSYAFKGNQLSSLMIPDSMTTIEEAAFQSNNLTSLTLPNSLTTIRTDAFRDNQLTALMIPVGVTTIEQGAFLDNNLKSLTLPGSLTTIGVDAFYDNQLESLVIPESVTTIGQGAFINNPQLSDVLVLNPAVTFNHNNIFNGSSSSLILYSEDSSTSQTFASTNGLHFQKITAELADLEINIPGLTFNPAARTFNLTTNANAVIVTPTPVVPFSEVQVNHALVPYGSDSPSIGLAEGTVTITLDVEAPDNSTEQYTVVFKVDHTSPSIDLTASPTTPTNGNVTVTVGTDGTGSAINSVKWAAGSQVAAFFATGGQVLSGGSFDAIANGMYTVYARDEAGNEAVQTITISNIDRNVPTIDLTGSPTSSTNGDVTVTVAAYANSGIGELKWAAGNEGTVFFMTGGEAIVGNAFTVTSNGTYTVYARDNAGNEAVEMITISNIDRNVPTIDLTGSPTSSTNGDVTVTVAAYANSGISELKWATGNEGTVFFTTGGEAIVGNAFTVTANGTYTVYARDNAGNEAVETIAISNIDRSVPTIDLSGNPTSSTNGEVTVTVAAYANSGISELKWAAGNEGTVFFTTGGEAIVGNAFTVTSNGTYTVYARDNAGNEAVEMITISNIVQSTSSGDSTPPDSPEDSDPRTILSIGPGVIIIEVAPRDIKEVPKDNGGVKEVVNLPDDVWDEIPKLLDDDRPVIRVIIDDHLPDVELHLPGKRLAEFKDINPHLEFDMQLNGSSFQLKVNILDLDQLATRLGMAVDEMNVIIKISALTGETKEDFILAADEQGMTLLSQVIEFQLFVSGGDKWVEITDFGGTYMTKSIVLDEQFANRNYLAVLYDPDGRTFTYVPAIMANRSNGQQDSVIQMPHNSIYAVLETDRIEFADMQGHWAESEVEQLGSKRIVRGITINDYAPNRNITRAEFASLLVRALGIKTDRTGAGDVFEDVAATSWYSTEVEAAFRAGLVNGISSTHFAPEAQITREQIAVMLMNAHALVKEEFNSIEQIPNSLTSFTDASEVSAWARAAMSEAVASKLIQGMNTDRLAPTASATRAQAAVMLHRLMVMIEFLD